ncbi:hypothetical protein ACE1BJ_18470, partial [Aeromonas jandaei]
RFGKQRHFYVNGADIVLKYINSRRLPLENPGRSKPIYFDMFNSHPGDWLCVRHQCVSARPLFATPVPERGTDLV